ncbi:MAG TPA: GAF domain-containing protein [Anaerolineales bacterium]|nr:GAF domain-containing protein [Anaerolineales bacterium]
MPDLSNPPFEVANNIERNQLLALHQATVTVASELNLERALQVIVDTARELAGAEYAALGVPGPDGHLEEFVYSGMEKSAARQIAHPPRGLGLLGALLNSKVSIRLSDLTQHEKSSGFPAGHPPMKSFLGVPILAGDQNLGTFYLTNKQSATDFSESDEQLIQLFAHHASIAIQNARLYKQVSRLAIQTERERIGMDLHDGIIQSIYAVGLTLESAKFAICDDQPDLQQLLDVAINALNQTNEDIRSFISELRPHRFHGNLQESILRLAEEFSNNTKIRILVEIAPHVQETLSPSAARAVFLTCQEALSNITRHAQANNAIVKLRPSADGIQLTISDNGRGFNHSGRLGGRGLGLRNMLTRAEQLGGSFTVFSQAGVGTTLEVNLPLG